MRWNHPRAARVLILLALLTALGLTALVFRDYGQPESEDDILERSAGRVPRLNNSDKWVI
jgi:hypothetical protein